MATDRDAQTLEQLFPGKLGKLRMTRVMLRHMELCIDKMPMNKALPEETLKAIRDAIAEDMAR